MSKKSRNQRTPKKNGKGKRKPAAQPDPVKAAERRKKRNRPGIKTLAAFLMLGAVSVAGATMYQNHHEELTDLTVIGNGYPTVVQVHDPGCSMCRALKKNTEQALRSHDDTIQYRIADIKTGKGRAFASEHGVQHVTLVTFSGNGKVVNKLNGVRKAVELEPYFERLVKRAKAVQSAKQSNSGS